MFLTFARSCCAKLETGQTFIKPRANERNNTTNIVGSCCVCLLVTLGHAFIFVFVVVFDAPSLFFLSLSIFFIIIKLRIVRKRLIKTQKLLGRL